MRKSGFWTVCFAFIPGAGQMYQGYMRRGLSMGLLVVVPFMLAAFMSMDVLIFPCLVLYMYSFFDTLNLRSQLTMGVAPPDDYLYHLNGAGGDLDRLLEKRHHLIGWALVLLGVFAIYNNFVSPWLWNLARLFGYESIFYNVLTSLINGVPNLLVAVALIVVGLWLVKGGRRSAAPVEDFTEFKGAEPKE